LGPLEEAPIGLQHGAPCAKIGLNTGLARREGRR
jgi:hypothetical protein